MAHELIKIKSSLYDTPLLITREGLAPVLQYIDERNAGQIEVRGAEERAEGSRRVNYNQKLKLGFVGFHGPTTYRPVTFMGMDCGGVSYQNLKRDFKELIDLGAKVIVGDFNSPGGEAHGAFDSAKYVRDMLDESGVKFIAFVDGRAASAGYIWASIADEVVLTSDSSVGSIGVLVQLTNNSKQLKDNGIERVFITAGKNKIPFDSDGNFTEAFKTSLQKEVDTTYEKFVGHVATYRGLTAQEVKDTEADMFTSENAIRAGLADKVMTPEEFDLYIAGLSSDPSSDDTLTKKVEDIRQEIQLSQEETILEEEIQSLTTQLSEANTKLADLTSQIEAGELKLADLLAQVQEKDELIKSLKAAEETAKLDARTSALVAAGIAQDDLEGMLQTLAPLDDEAFAVVAKTITAKTVAQKESHLFEDEPDAQAVLSAQSNDDEATQRVKQADEQTRKAFN